MTRFLIRRILQIPIALFYIVTITFVVTRLSGDPTPLMLPSNATLDEIAAFRQKLGLDQPIYVQYIDFLASAVHGDLGKSLQFNENSLQLVLERLPATIELAVAALSLAIVLGLGAGIISATHKGTWLDDVSMILALLGQAIPVFWLGLILIIVFAVNLRWLPVYGTGDWTHLVLPTVTLAVYSTARIARLSRSSILEVLRDDYIRTAYAKGLSEHRVLFGHVLKNAAIPIVTIIGLEVGSLFSGAVVTETVFAWPGMGTLVTASILSRDYPVVVAAVLVSGFIFMVSALLVDLLYVAFNPRIRYG